MLSGEDVGARTCDSMPEKEVGQVRRSKESEINVLIALLRCRLDQLLLCPQSRIHDVYRECRVAY